MGLVSDVATAQSVLASIQKNLKSLYAAESRVASYIMQHPAEAVQANISDLAERSNVSDATVVRCCKRLGFSGFYQLKLQLSHDLGMQQNQSLSGAEVGYGTLQEAFSQMGEEIANLSRRLDETQVKKCAADISRCHTVHVVGAGHSQILANDMIFRLAGYGIRTTGARNTKTDICNLLLGDPNDVLVCISKSGETKQTNQAMKLATKIGMTTIAITVSEKNPLCAIATYALHSGGGLRQTDGSNLCLMAIINAIFSFVQNKIKDQAYFEELIAESRL